MKKKKLDGWDGSHVLRSLRLLLVFEKREEKKEMEEMSFFASLAREMNSRITSQNNETILDERNS